MRDHQIIHPQRDWTLGLLGGLILLIAGGAWSVVTYQEVTERDVENTQTEEIKQTIYRDDIVNTALRDLEERHQRYLNMIEEYQVDEPVYFEEEIDIKPFLQQYLETQAKHIIEEVTDGVANIVDKIGDGIDSITGNVIKGIGNILS